MNENKVLERGPPELKNEALSEPEAALLRAVLGRGAFVTRLARAPGGWRTLSEHELRGLKLTPRQKNAVLALQVLVRRSYPDLVQCTVACAADVARVYGHRLGGEVREVLLALALDGKNRVLAEVIVAEGGAHGVSLRPRDVLRPLLRIGASAFILIHNHPSGDPIPSEGDVLLTRTLQDCATAVGVPLVDHVIIAGRGGGMVSLLDHGVVSAATSRDR
jgi:DNA repair protein RadC